MQHARAGSAAKAPDTCRGERVSLEVPLVVGPDGVNHAGLRAASSSFAADAGVADVADVADGCTSAGVTSVACTRVGVTAAAAAIGR